MRHVLIGFLLFSNLAFADTYTVDSRAFALTQYVTPSTGNTVAVNAGGNTTLLINPSGTLLALTVNFPSSPNDGDSVTLASSQIITTFTIGNGTVIGPLTTMAVGTFAKYQFNSTASKWFRIG